MSIQFKCQACGTVIQVADEHAGLQVQCPACRAVIVAPTEGDSSAEQPPIPPKMTPPTQSTYAPGPPDEGRKGLAIAAMVCGIVGFCLWPLGLIALILGIIAVVKASSNPMKYSGTGLAIVGICTGVLSFLLPALLFAILMPSLSRARELSKRAVCAANMNQMGRGFYSYGNENNDYWPIAAPYMDKNPWPDGKPPAPGQGFVTYAGVIGQDQPGRGSYDDPDAGNPATYQANNKGVPAEKLSVTRSMWMLVRIAAATPKEFVCPSSNDEFNDEDQPQVYWDFGWGDDNEDNDGRSAWIQCSYGYQVPFGSVGQPSSNNDSSMPLAADKGPYGAALDGGYNMPANPSANALSSPKDWRPWNSPNHGGIGGGEGQNVLFADSHVAFFTKPTAGMDNDNIYTQWSGDGTNELERMQGAVPTVKGRQTPVGGTDSLIYP